MYFNPHYYRHMSLSRTAGEIEKWPSRVSYSFGTRVVYAIKYMYLSEIKRISC